MAAKRTLMVFCTLYGLAKVVGTVLYHLRGAGQLQLAVLIVSLVVGVIGLGDPYDSCAQPDHADNK